MPKTINDLLSGTVSGASGPLRTLTNFEEVCTEAQYLAVPTNHRLEFTDGRIEPLPMPTLAHQLILQFLYDLLKPFVSARGLGTLIVAAYPVRVREGKFREPDLIFVLAEHADRLGTQFADGADLVVEVVSENNRSHDLETKRAEYAQAGIPEYWIVDPATERITVLTLAGDAYAVHGEFAPGDMADSSLLPGFAADVTAVFAAGQPRRDG